MDDKSKFEGVKRFEKIVYDFRVGHAEPFSKFIELEQVSVNGNWYKIKTTKLYSRFIRLLVKNKIRFIFNHSYSNYHSIFIFNELYNTIFEKKSDKNE